MKARPTQNKQRIKEQPLTYALGNKLRELTLKENETFNHINKVLGLPSNFLSHFTTLQRKSATLEELESLAIYFGYNDLWELIKEVEDEMKGERR